MEQWKNRKAEPHYYSDRLKHKFAKIRFAPATVVEAPSGYGKTTAVRDYLETMFPQGTPVYWFTATNESPAECFKRFCLEIEKIDSHAGKRLLRVEFPNTATISEVIDALKSIRCIHEAYLVLDNFQFLNEVFPPAFFAALLEHSGAGLHVIVITQMLKRSMLAVITGHGVLHITATDLRLSAEDIRCYYALANVNITQEEAENVEHYTEGWIIAVYLQLRAFRETGTFSDASGILAHMEHLVWDTLTEEQQDFLLHLSTFEKITIQQASCLIGCDVLPEYTWEALDSPFIQYNPVERCYELHSILSDLLIQKRGERGFMFERKCLLQAGDFCRDNGQIAVALGFYAQVGDYERMLSLDLSHMTFETVNGVPFDRLALDIAMNCPPDLKKAQILNMLRIAWTLLTFGINDAFEALMNELRTMLDAEDKVLPYCSSQDTDSQLLGEWLLLSSYRCFPHMNEMIAVLKQAAVLLGDRCSQVILPDALWCFGNYSPLTVFYTTPGEADREAEALEEYIAIYSRLTNGHGSGTDALFRAELAYQRGDLNDAEILAYKASFFAESKQQSVVQLGAAILLAHIALHKADIAGWQRAINSMERAASFEYQDTFVIRSLLDIIRGVLLNEFQNQTSIADWLKNADFGGNCLLPGMINSALYVHLSFLMHQGEFARVIGTLQAVRSADGLLSPYADLFACFPMAISYMALGNHVRAAAFVEHAARRALPDGLVSPFAAFSRLLHGLVEKVIERDHLESLDKFRAVRKRFTEGWFTLREALFQGELPPDLTEREYEVARLAAQGLRNSEIAEKLVITESTVRTHLRTVFQKLQIDRRAKLAEKLK
ncbi:MAG: LuxR C-terminal-related transcriptional regulator [Clostridia bacterium]|nr:LuxR C-terminal-related transcriptional regulator [Clostridia bacterium]